MEQGEVARFVNQYLGILWRCLRSGSLPTDGYWIRPTQGSAAAVRKENNTLMKACSAFTWPWRLTWPHTGIRCKEKENTPKALNHLLSLEGPHGLPPAGIYVKYPSVQHIRYGFVRLHVTPFVSFPLNLWRVIHCFLCCYMGIGDAASNLWVREWDVLGLVACYIVHCGLLHPPDHTSLHLFSLLTHPAIHCYVLFNAYSLGTSENFVNITPK